MCHLLHARDTISGTTFSLQLQSLLRSHPSIMRDKTGDYSWFIRSLSQPIGVYDATYGSYLQNQYKMKIMYSNQVFDCKASGIKSALVLEGLTG